MKVCPNCNAVAQDDHPFCSNCGAAFSTGNQEKPAPERVPFTPPYQIPVEPVSTGKWVLYQLIPYIPFIGGIVFIIMLFVWGFGDSHDKTFRNWARSRLIFSLISLILLILFVVFFGALFSQVYTDLTTSSYMFD